MTQVNTILDLITAKTISEPDRFRAGLKLRQMGIDNADIPELIRTARVVAEDVGATPGAIVILTPLIHILLRMLEANMHYSHQHMVETALCDLVNHSNDDVATVAISSIVGYRLDTPFIIDTLKSIVCADSIQMVDGHFTRRGLAFRALAHLSSDAARSLKDSKARLECIEILRHWVSRQDYPLSIHNEVQIELSKVLALDQS